MQAEARAIGQPEINTLTSGEYQAGSGSVLAARAPETEILAAVAMDIDLQTAAGEFGAADVEFEEANVNDFGSRKQSGFSAIDSAPNEIVSGSKVTSATLSAVITNDVHRPCQKRVTTLRKGNILLAPLTATVIQTPLGNVELAPHSLANTA